MVLCHEIFKMKGNSEIIALPYRASGEKTKDLKLVAELGPETPPLYPFFYNSEVDEPDQPQSLSGFSVITLFSLSSSPRMHAPFILMSFENQAVLTPRFHQSFS